MAKTQDLSARLQAVADMVTAGNKVCDVGCDHGYIPIYLVQRNISPAVIAMDINKGPLERAKAHVTQAGLEMYITLRLSDGLKKFQIGEAQTLICAGMGGPLMQKILTDDLDKAKQFQELILQPQSEISAFRKFLREAGYLITDENMILEDEKFYPMMRAVPAMTDDIPHQTSELEDDYGPILLKSKNPVLIQFMKQEWEKTKSLLNAVKHAEQTVKVQKRLAQLQFEQNKLQAADRLYKLGGIQ